MIIADVISAGFVWGTVAAIIVLVLGLVIGFALSRDTYDSVLGYGIMIGTVLIVGGIWLAASWPLKYDYHHWVDIRGKVQKVSSRFISAGSDKGTNQLFVFVLGGKAYGVDDTRASLARVGSVVHLRCKKEHQWFQDYSDDGWACRWMNDSELG